MILVNFKGNRCGTRKGIKFWIERLIINSTEKLFWGDADSCQLSDPTASALTDLI